MNAPQAKKIEPRRHGDTEVSGDKFSMSLRLCGLKISAASPLLGVV